MQGDNVYRWEDIFSSVPQGLVIGPLFFVLFIKDLPENPYADNTKILNEMLSPASTWYLHSNLDLAFNWTGSLSSTLTNVWSYTMHPIMKNLRYL